MFCSMIRPSASLTVTQWLNNPTTSSFVFTESIGGLNTQKLSSTNPVEYYRKEIFLFAQNQNKQNQSLLANAGEVKVQEFSQKSNDK